MPALNHPTGCLKDRCRVVGTHRAYRIRLPSSSNCSLNWFFLFFFGGKVKELSYLLWCIQTLGLQNNLFTARD